MMTTYSGRNIDPYNVNPDDIHIRDIAHHLSMLCRFGGASKVFYSVAQHSVRVSQSLPQEFWLDGLMHDAAEAYVQDLIRPIKVLKMMEPYRQLERFFVVAISERYKVPSLMSKEVKHADIRALKAEMQQFIHGSSVELSNPRWASIIPLDPIDNVWDPNTAEDHFLATLQHAIEAKRDPSEFRCLWSDSSR